MDTEWIVLICVLVLLWFVRKKVIEQEKENPTTHKPDYARTKNLFDLARQKLEQKGLGDLMMTDYRIKTKVGSPKFTSTPVLERQLQSVLMELLTRLHLMPDVRLIVTDDPKVLVNKNAMGEYSGEYNNKQIRLLISFKYTAKDIVAALCHECAHYFAYSYGIAEANSEINEGLTDTLCILLGFGDAVLTSNTNRPYPYLNGKEFLKLNGLLNQYRKEKKAEKAKEENLESARKQLIKNIAGAREMITQAHAIVTVKRTPSKNKRMSSKELMNLQKILMEFESGSFSETLNTADKAATGSFMQIRQADYKVLEICEKVYKLMLAFQ